MRDDFDFESMRVEGDLLNFELADDFDIEGDFDVEEFRPSLKAKGKKEIPQTDCGINWGVIDFESTTTNPSHPYAFAMCHRNDTKYSDTKFVYDINYKSFMNGVIKLIFNKYNTKVLFAHNLKYDISIILSYLYREGVLNLNEYYNNKQLKTNPCFTGEVLSYPAFYKVVAALRKKERRTLSAVEKHEYQEYVEESKNEGVTYYTEAEYLADIEMRELNVTSEQYDEIVVLRASTEEYRKILQEKSGGVVLSMTHNVMSYKVTHNGKTIEFRDSYALFTAPLEKVLKAYTSMRKGETPIFEDIKDVKKTYRIGTKAYGELRDYTMTDVYGLREALLQRLELGLKLVRGKLKPSLSTASGAMQEFKSSIDGKFDEFYPYIGVEFFKEFSPAYSGGFTYVNSVYKGSILKGPIYAYDVNSMYPAQMMNELLPFGIPVKVEGDVRESLDDTYKLGVQRFRIGQCSLKKNGLPIISNGKNFRGHAHFLEEIGFGSKDSERIYAMTLRELDVLKSCYDITGLDLIDGWIFQASDTNFKEYIDRFMEMKASDDPVKKALGKLFMNSLYGKFGENPEKQKTGIEWSDTMSKLIFVDRDIKEAEIGYIPVAAFITSYSRCQLVRTAQSIGVEHFVYCDTDSMYVKGLTRDEIESKIDVHGSRLGAWKYEGEFKEMKFIRPKRYFGVDKDGKNKIVCGGIKIEHIHKVISGVDKFQEGVKIPTGNMRMGVNGMYWHPNLKTI